MASALPSGRSRAPGAAAQTGAWLALAALLAAATPAALAGESDLEVEVGLFHDDNPFETPSRSYFDQFDEVTVDPGKSPGFFVPITLDGGYLVPNERHQFVLDYRVRHHEYGRGNGNADETYVNVAPGYQWVTSRKSGRKGLFFAVPFAKYRKEIFFDRDTGVGEVVGFEDVSNRYTYHAAGGDVGFSTQVNRDVDWEVAARYEGRNYEDVPSLSSLDHRRFQIGSKLEIGINRRLKLYLDYTFRVLDYEERPSRDRDGGITAGRTPLEYAYHIAGTTLRYKPVERWTLYFDVDYTGRSDEFAGYNDYGMLGGRVRAIWTDGSSRVRLALRYWRRDYPRAFIFDKEVNPGTGRDNPNKDYDIVDSEIGFEMPLSRSTSFFAEADLRVQDAADPRFTYERLRIGAGLKWAFGSSSR